MAREFLFIDFKGTITNIAIANDDIQNLDYNKEGR